MAIRAALEAVRRPVGTRCRRRGILCRYRLLERKYIMHSRVPGRFGRARPSANGCAQARMARPGAGSRPPPESRSWPLPVREIRRAPRFAVRAAHRSVRASRRRRPGRRLIVGRHTQSAAAQDVHGCSHRGADTAGLDGRLQDRHGPRDRGSDCARHRCTILVVDGRTNPLGAAPRSDRRRHGPARRRRLRSLSRTRSYVTTSGWTPPTMRAVSVDRPSGRGCRGEWRHGVP